ncbi:hypothetical protein [Actinomadura macrotermitis]|uniref:Uncharacterized protein n=1 Tax=Actinomadura macrotermitis TaxID=2585200 RepID=A0A7K0BX29_9ACTN|nr:hypothetical protein [Actinomadura macrotermitis]MQY05432.1 hypothetical protein [Actinomadura macrotermitis]
MLDDLEGGGRRNPGATRGLNGPHRRRRGRRQAIEHITELLEQPDADEIKKERNRLDGCRDAIGKATAILLDEGKVGASLGLDSASYAISTALVTAERRLAGWQSALDALPGGAPVETGTLTESFPGLADDHGGKFRGHLELAAPAIALKRRVVVLQAVEHAQSDSGDPFENFIRGLKDDQQRLDDLEPGIAGVLVRLSALELTRPPGLRPVFTTAEVERLMRAAHRIRRLGDGSTSDGRARDVAIEIARGKDGSVIVFPAPPA